MSYRMPRHIRFVGSVAEGGFDLSMAQMAGVAAQGTVVCNGAQLS